MPAGSCAAGTGGAWPVRKMPPEPSMEKEGRSFSPPKTTAMEIAS